MSEGQVKLKVCKTKEKFQTAVYRFIRSLQEAEKTGEGEQADFPPRVGISRGMKSTQILMTVSVERERQRETSERRISQQHLQPLLHNHRLIIRHEHIKVLSGR